MKKLLILTLTLLSTILMGFQFQKTEKHHVSKEMNHDCELQLVGLKCVTPEGLAFPDAIYFKIGGIEWPDERLRMSTGDYRDLEGYADIGFNNSITIELWDDDTFDPDDFLGRNTIRCSYDSDGVVRFTEDGANYKLYYRVK